MLSLANTCRPGTGARCDAATATSRLRFARKPAFAGSRSTRRSLQVTAAVSSHVPRDPIKPDLPGSSGWPVIGETLDALKDPDLFIEAKRAIHGPVFKTNLLGKHSVVVCTSDLVSEVFKAEHISMQTEYSESIMRLLGSKLFGDDPKVVTKASHKESRALMSEFLSPQAIEAMYPAIEENIRAILSKMMEEQEVLMLDYGKKIAFDVFNAQIMGIRIREDMRAEMNGLWIDLLNGFNDPFPLNCPFTTFGKATAAADRMDEILEECLEEMYPPTQLDREYGGHNLVQAWLKLKRSDGSWRYTIKDIARMAKGMLLAGHETTAWTLTGSLRWLTENPKVLRRLREEQASLESLHGPSITADVLRGTYTEAIAHEVLRMNLICKDTQGPWPFVSRIATNDFKIREYTIKAGTKVMIPTGHINKDVREFRGNRFEFRPERWLPEDSHPEADNVKPVSVSNQPKGFMPFGGGPRICPGNMLAMAELLVFLTLLGRHVDFELSNPSEKWLTMKGTIASAPEDGMPVRLSPRAGSSPLSLH